MIKKKLFIYFCFAYTLIISSSNVLPETAPTESLEFSETSINTTNKAIQENINKTEQIKHNFENFDIQDLKKNIEHDDNPTTTIQESENPIIDALDKKSSNKKSSRKKSKLIQFSWNETPLVKIIDIFAKKMGINIIVPQGANAIKNNITFIQKNKISLEQAENYIHTFLQLSGYSLHQEHDFFIITKINENTETRQPLHLYVNIDPDKLPKSEEHIRAIYYLSNFKVPQSPQGNEPLNVILRDMLNNKRGYLFDPKSNAIILNGSSNKIASAMTVILALDSSGSPETIQVIPLYNAAADNIVKILNELISANNKNGRGPQGPGMDSTGSYFNPNTRVYADNRTNSLIIIGTESGVNRIKEFIREHMDAPAESGDSIIHVYDLQYLNSREFAGVLQRLVKKSSTGQSQQSGGAGPYKFFQDVIIIAEEEKTVESKEVGDNSYNRGTKGRITVGGNRLIIAARKNDWHRLKELIAQLDKPMLQVIIEVMVLDISLEGDKLIQAQTRNPKSINLHENIEFQTAHMREQILDTNNSTIAPDLLRLLTGTNSMAFDETRENGIGSMIISFTDPCNMAGKDPCNTTGANGVNNGIWGVLKILDKWVERKVISHPFIVTKNNVKGKELAVDIRRDAGQLRNDNSGVTTTLQQDFKAVLAVEVTPRISSIDRLNLQIKIEIEDFVGTTGFNRTVRSLETNANLSSGEVLVLGGLTKTNTGEIVTKWPILGDIPIIGTFFRGNALAKRKNNLAVFIHPTIVNPKLRAGQKQHTSDKIADQDNRINQSELFSKTQDPIIRLFFQNDKMDEAPEILKKYLKEIKYTKDHNDTNYDAIDHDSDGTVKNIAQVSKADELKSLLNGTDHNPFAK